MKLKVGDRVRLKNALSEVIEAAEPGEDESVTGSVTENAEHCVCCGDVIPEGRQVCINCEEVIS